MHFFGSEVRRAREAAGMTQVELGDLVPCDKSVVSRIEGGLVHADEPFARACDVAFPHMSGFFSRFWRDCQSWGVAFPAAFRDFASYEAEAIALWSLEHSLMPGLLQTEDYARAVLERHPRVTPDEVTERVSARVTRQAILDGDRAPRYWVLLDENVLHREVGGPEVMRDQLKYLAAMARQSNVTVQVLPRIGAHIGHQGGFAMAETHDARVVFLEHFTGGMTIDSPAVVAEASVQFDMLRTDAYRGTESQSIIERMAEEWTP
jgi:hypothetical protein